MYAWCSTHSFIHAHTYIHNDKRLVTSIAPAEALLTAALNGAEFLAHITTCSIYVCMYNVCKMYVCIEMIKISFVYVCMNEWKNNRERNTMRILMNTQGKVKGACIACHTHIHTCIQYEDCVVPCHSPRRNSSAKERRSSEDPTPHLVLTQPCDGNKIKQSYMWVYVCNV